MIRAVLFDLDDTLFDHAGCARAALAGVQGCHTAFGRMPFVELERAHAAHLETLHRDVLAGRATIDAARRERFRRLLLDGGVEPDDDSVAAAAEAYRRAYIEARRAVEGAAALLDAVRARARVAIVSNNLHREQAAKIRACGLEPLIDLLVVSEEAGVAKPDPAIFRLTLDRLGCGADETVMVGDSWAADVEGARAAGIRPVWFNPHGAPPPDPKVAVLRALAPPDQALALIFDHAHRD